ncbi:MAG: hypothetical protein JWO37_1522 [Acidimicrobiales bacterium]|jgi:hypothetical protein|nr:hypothetical protein [Acidimicrobiales bacterium]
MAARRAPSLEALFIAAVALFGFGSGTRPISDNSMFLHMRTGIEIATGHGIPSHDPYSFTAHGHGWVVQSWFAELTYGIAHRIGGFSLVSLEQGLLMGLLALLIAILARAGTPLRTALAAVIAVGVGSAFWSPRPLLYGLLALALTVWVVDRRKSPWLLLPVVWIWVNTHGSFPLGLAWLAARVVGELIDRRAVPRETLRYLGVFILGLGVAALNPVGPKLLTFPLAVGDKREIFKTIVEWRSPNFQESAGLTSLVFLSVALIVLLRRKVDWADLLPAVGFVALGLLAMRNVPAAGIVLAPVIGRALRPQGALPGVEARLAPPGGVNWALGGVLAIVYLAFAVGSLQGTGLDTKTYPVAAARQLDRMGLLREPHRVAEQDIVGCYLILRDVTKPEGLRTTRDFIDDRYDMYPLAVSRAYGTLLHGGATALDVLDRYGVDVVLWNKGLPLVGQLQATGRWRQIYADTTWIALQRA